MQGQVKSALILLIAVFALLAVLAMLTGALPSLGQANPALFAFGALLFLASIVAWLAAWAMLIKRREKGFAQNILVGFACVFASLTPVQLGSDAMRSLKMKEVFSVPYRETIASSMVVKGVKFLLIALVASLSFFAALFNPDLPLWIKAAMLSGFAVVSLAALLFLLPLKRSIGFAIAGLFKRLSAFLKIFSRIAEYFEHYSSYLQQISLKRLALVALLALASISLEFAAFLFSFLSANAVIPLYSALVLFAILSILERTPFLPRGIGVVEAFGVLFLSIDSFTAASLDPGQIVTVIILFDVMRLIIPTAASLIAYYAFFQRTSNTTGTKRVPNNSGARWAAK